MLNCISIKNHNFCNIFLPLYEGQDLITHARKLLYTLCRVITSIMTKHITAAACILLFTLCPLFAESTQHIIETYEFEIPGKTREQAVRREIVPPEGDPPFESRENLEDALESKARKLFNMRIFNEVEYSVEEISSDEHAVYYQANFYIDDAFTFLPIPYAKYDSNYGTRGGIKIYERNLFGSFADLYYVGHVSQVDTSWDSMTYFSLLRINDIPLGEATMRFFNEFEFTHTDREYIDDASFEISADITDIPIFNNTLSLKTTLGVEQHGRDEHDSPVWGDGSLDAALGIGRIIFSNQPFRYSHTLSLSQREDDWTYPDAESDLQLTWLDLSLFGHPYSIWFNSDMVFSTKERSMAKNEFSIGADTSFSLPFGIRYRTSAEFLFELEPVFPENYSLSTTHRFTGGSINWHNNFRKGIEASLQFEGDYSFGEDYREYPDFEDRTTYTIEGELTTFMLLWDRLNISSRLLGYYAYRPFEDYPSFLPSSRKDSTGELRGILLRNYSGRASRKYGLTHNLNLTVLAMNIDGFAEGFITPFFDFGLFHNEGNSSEETNLYRWNDTDVLATVGIEAHGFFDRFRSYPFRASIGFNAMDMHDHIRGDIPFSDVERELVLTMDLHF